MRHHLICFVLAANVLSLRAAPKSPSTIRRLDGTTISHADAEAFARNTLQAAHVAGAQIAVAQDGKLAWSMAFGVRGRDPDLPMTRQTTTWAASITKSVFATYVMRLVERGEFSLDLPIVQQLPQPLASYGAYGKKASDLANDPAWLTVTPRMLLSHSSGLQNFAAMEPDGKMRLHFPPGSHFLYSGEGINLLQFVIEQRLKRPLNELMQEALFTPLGMTRTGMIYRSEFANDVADRFDLQGAFLSQTRRDTARAAGSMTTAAEDLARFAEALLNDRILKPGTRKEMLRPVLTIHTPHQFPGLPLREEGAEAEAVGLAYGIGWGLLTHTKFGLAFFKEGHGDGAQNYMICFERQKTCMIVLSNSDNGELAFRPLLETILGDTVTPWEWESYTPAAIEAGRKFQ